MSTSAAPSLTSFLASSKRDFLAQLKTRQGLDQWTLATGNEAGDLDSIASAVGFAYLASQRGSKRKYAALCRTNVRDHYLRPENVWALEQVGLDPAEHLISLEELPQPIDSLGVQFALVDHNKLGAEFGGSAVEAIIDHHDDEGLYKSASPRDIQIPTGSCSSLIARHFRSETIPMQLADLLISAILIDTNNLKPAPEGKAVGTDREAMELLAPLSSLSGAVALHGKVFAQSLEVSAALSDRNRRLKAEKNNINSLSTRDLLRRDYKEYESDQGWRYGLSSSPLGLHEWLSRENHGWESMLEDLRAWAEERRLDLFGVLTSFGTTDEEQSKGLEKHAREVLLISTKGQADIALDAMHESPDMRFGEWVWSSEEDFRSKTKDQPIRVWQQLDLKATRKQVAPALKHVVENQLSGRRA
ncbi:uncharacterized protein L969DRAFT_92839 [Mixia osmundae IAM 14324]|uniref:DHHA2 domain-containing protein n=1 Tax=Mixia osmundae (strain CBS 9802 / IAM 14324 / JCM 22182 / KY 12970) TaxID=764103 RepID=G7DYQ3_MIXOS|nr:uncharacterized protein L969DRAFT_92839 [Mixia osmundae IAM 14324]KEI41613.1 hypothetical protein L969DRAFT_92839 [Mixia osmundae IAM 14324]GAA95713.1 hypothetical protein E5Q_02370 [Mixia osmundae IAM 14324]